MSCESCLDSWLRNGWRCWECGAGLCLRAGHPLPVPLVKEANGKRCWKCKTWCRDEDDYELHCEVRLCSKATTIDNVCAYFTKQVRRRTEARIWHNKKHKMGWDVLNYDAAWNFLQVWIYFLSHTRVGSSTSTTSWPLKRTYHVPVVVFHWTNASRIIGIEDKGFKILQLRDKGFYGCGIYASEEYDSFKEYGDRGLICLCLPGRRFPATFPQHEGADLADGFDSHVSADDKDGLPGDQIVIFDQKQIIPLYVVDDDEEESISGLLIFIKQYLVPKVLRCLLDCDRKTSLWPIPGHTPRAAGVLIVGASNHCPSHAVLLGGSYKRGIRRHIFSDYGGLLKRNEPVLVGALREFCEECLGQAETAATRTAARLARSSKLQRSPTIVHESYIMHVVSAETLLCLLPEPPALPYRRDNKAPLDALRDLAKWNGETSAVALVSMRALVERNMMMDGTGTALAADVRALKRNGEWSTLPSDEGPRTRISLRRCFGGIDGSLDPATRVVTAWS